MNELAAVSGDKAAKLVSCAGVSLLLGYHPRANVGFAVALCMAVARGGRKSFILDCDHTVTLDSGRAQLGEGGISNVLLSHPENVVAFEGDLKAARSVGGVGMVAINRASSLVDEARLIERFEEKRKLWTLAYHPIRDLSREHPVLILEDSRRYDQMEYKIHPALYYLSESVLVAVEEGKEVQHYRIMKKRPDTA